MYQATKFVTKFVAGVGAFGIVQRIVANNVVPLTQIQKVMVGAGTIGLALAASEVAEKAIDRQFEEVRAALANNKEETEK